MPETTVQNTKTIRPPIIVVMGHIDHGKSTLLDHIRESNVVEKEKGGITQHVYAYEIEHGSTEGAKRKITFLDTPGHEAFSLIRERGAAVADIAILVVAAEEGVKPQTLEALKAIRKGDIPFIVAINKIDKPGANPEKVKQELAEHEVFVEGYGGDVPVVEISAKTGHGVDELLDMMLLLADMAELTATLDEPARGIVIESHRDPKTGISATVVVQSGTLRRGMYTAVGSATAPVRYIETFLGESLDVAVPSTPVRITGFNEAPKVGAPFRAFESKKEAEQYAVSVVEETGHAQATPLEEVAGDDHTVTLNLIVKADSHGTLEGALREIGKISIENVALNIITHGVGNISESDVKRAVAADNSIVLGFNISIENAARVLGVQHGITIKTFDVIYRLTEWLEGAARERKPRITSEEVIGSAKVIRHFSAQKDKQVLGGKVREGKLATGAEVKILRREHEIGRGIILELQQQKVKADSVEEGNEFGAMVESKQEIAPGDKLEAFIVVEK